MLHAPTPARERIMLFGPYGSGKSYAWVQIAEWLERTGSDANLYVIDSLGTAERDAGHLKNVIAYEWDGWEELEKITDACLVNLRRGVDWLVVDLISTPWETAQSHYIEMVMAKGGQRAATWRLEWKAKGGEGHPLVGEEAFGMNWSHIKAYYNDWLGRVVRSAGHVVGCADAEQVYMPNPARPRESQRADSPETVRDFGPYGMKPAGEKRLPQPFHTVLLMNHPTPDQWSFTTIRDRRRERVVNEPLTDFVAQYLIRVAGWEVA